MANVYYAEHQLLERPLVIKVLHSHLARDAEMRERFRREAEAASQLVHPHICTIIDYAEAAEAVFIVMPYLAGGSLADVLVKERTVAPGPATAVCAQISTALDYAHRRGVVHRDVKPDNVLFDEDGHALITDFGIATARFHGRLTGTGRAMGTPHYMSPEQAMGKMVDGRSDIYAVGVLAFELFTGQLPFVGKDAQETMMARLKGLPRRLREFRPDLPSRLDAIVARALELAPEDRYQTMNDFANALERVVSGGRIARLFRRRK
jgi:serine/threonine-protein kinase